VAGFTGGNGVDSDQRETSQVVLEADPLSPILYVVAFVALFPLLAFMNIIRFVAGKTGFLHFDFFLHRLRMTSEAYHLVVRSFQRKLGLFVVVKIP